MANPEHVQIAKEGADAIEKWRLSHLAWPVLDLEGADLTRANISINTLGGGDYYEYANLDGANLDRSRLSSATLKGVCLTGAVFRGANLSGANLEGALLERADFTGANLERANLRRTDLKRANLIKANLKGANLGFAVCEDTVFADVDLSEVKGMEDVSHHGPSSIGIDTLCRSKGTIPEVFLAGAGVPDSIIVCSRLPETAAKELKLHLPLLDVLAKLRSSEERATQQQHTYDIFLSYSSLDQEQANILFEAIKKAGGRPFLSSKNLTPGDDFAEEIRNQLNASRELWLLVSPNSLKSEWVLTEWGAAWMSRKRIIPLCIGASQSSFQIA